MNDHSHNLHFFYSCQLSKSRKLIHLNPTSWQTKRLKQDQKSVFARKKPGFRQLILNFKNIHLFKKKLDSQVDPVFFVMPPRLCRFWTGSCVIRDPGLLILGQTFPQSGWRVGKPTRRLLRTRSFLRNLAPKALKEGVLHPVGHRVHGALYPPPDYTHN